MATPCSSFEVLAEDAKTHARRGTLSLPHGPVRTPAFMPVGTYGAVKGMTPRDLKEVDSDIILSNTFHLICRPGTELIREVGGLHRFMGWEGPILTDSGGFQVFSLKDLRTLDDDGVTFRNPKGGDLIRMTPESCVRAQLDLGVDVGMVLADLVALPSPDHRVREAMERSLRWAERALEVPRNSSEGTCLFGIVQGGLDRDLRAESIERLCSLPFDGFAIGGLSVGEAPEDRNSMVGFAAPRLPGDRVRYLMGVGYPEDIIEAVAAGIDLFDCVLPTRNARNGNLFTSRGRLVIKHAAWRADERPIDEDCNCFTCRNFSRAYLRHLFVSGDSLAARLNTMHNLHHYQQLMTRIRRSISDGSFNDLLLWARQRNSKGEGPSKRRADEER
ncbi:MAG: tRNA guanosine(34) transglycosylase Tgt [Myxococcota bacterium]|nr:tRNA guanosine(34) transglycosylase Tgt [Myxococcota bacterium]